MIWRSVPELVAQRVYALALGYEDLSDHDQLREDPRLAVLGGKRRLGQEALAGKSTLRRLELGGVRPTRYKKISYSQAAIDELLTQVFLEAHTEAPEQIVLGPDTTDLALHAHQEGRFLHGYCDSYCYLPLHISACEHLLCARLRRADQNAAAGNRDEVERIVRYRGFGAPIGHCPEARLPQDDTLQPPVATIRTESLRQDQPPAAPLRSSRPCPTVCEKSAPRTSRRCRRWARSRAASL